MKQGNDCKNCKYYNNGWCDFHRAYCNPLLMSNYGMCFNETPKEDKMREYKLTKEKILAMADECEDVKRVLKRAFPDVFEDKWEDITEECEFEPRSVVDGNYLLIYHNGDNIGYINLKKTRIYDVDSPNYKLEHSDDGGYFVIYQKK